MNIFYALASKPFISVTYIICNLCLYICNEIFYILHLLQKETLQFKQREGCWNDVFVDVGGVTEMDLV